MTQVTFHSIYIAGFSLVILLHTLGLYLLSTVKTGLPNQKALVINLASTELVLSTFMVIGYSANICGAWNLYWDYVDVFMLYLSYISIRVAIFYIIMDRFMEIYLNIKYPL